MEKLIFIFKGDYLNGRKWNGKGFDSKIMLYMNQKMEKVISKNIIKMTNYLFKENIYLVKQMKKEKNISLISFI